VSDQVREAILAAVTTPAADPDLTLIKLLIVKSRDGLTSCFVVGVG